MLKLLKKKQSLRNLLRISFLLLTASILYWQLNLLGYLPPVSYFLSQPENNDGINLSPPSNNLLNYEQSLSEIITSPLEKSQTAILIDKSNYQLTLYYQQEAVKSYPIVLGINPIEDKQREGDYKTPEGVFKVRDLYPHQSWSKFIWLDYPNYQSWRKHLAAKKAGKISLLSTVGSEIGIHGVPPNGDRLIDARDHWTWGCISLKNQDVDELYGAIQTGTIVKIIP